MVGIQVGSEQEERKAKEEGRSRDIVIFHIAGNAAEELRGWCIQARKISSSIAQDLARWRGERGDASYEGGYVFTDRRSLS